MRCLLRLGVTGRIEVVSPFDAVTQAQLRAIRPRGRWLGRRSCWEFPLEAAAALKAALAGRFPVEPELAQWLAWMQQPLPPLPLHREEVHDQCDQHEGHEQGPQQRCASRHHPGISLP